MNENDSVRLPLKSILAGLAVIMLLLMGGALAMFALHMTFNSDGRFGYGIYWIGGTIVATLWVCIPNGMMVIHGLSFFSKWNLYNCVFQLGASLAWLITGGLQFWPIHLISILLPMLCLRVLLGDSYHQFVEFYYHLQTNRRRERKELKAEVERLKKSSR